MNAAPCIEANEKENGAAKPHLFYCICVKLNARTRKLMQV